ncbi:alpha/beta fold hydrolase [Novosphingobium sp. FSY-8]|uniref:Palmitoyl-protein thioesterase ABHD10, mitochondrial n=1 Tax=Novosphingobium ovatum TaxID=1908523 RepID=A0ABW9XES2_9SPHN|nr:alpha/beta hydrolase [Novosphingobium ovatum]NBC37035.1 alpha/beta fold hydrolase [Novosphingobium ovatum]
MTDTIPAPDGFFPHAPADGAPIRAIAWRHTPAPDGAATIVFLPGYMSDMAGGKACAVFDWARASGRGCLLLDYSGCGQSDGDFADGTLSRWADEVCALIAAKASGPVVLVGSSMGGWLMLLVALRLGDQAQALVGIAPAPDFTQWGFDAQAQALLASGATHYRDNAYGYDPTPTHAGFWADGQANRLLGQTIPLDCPVRLLHGQDDDVVPTDISMRLMAALRSDDVQVSLIKGGDHRLSRPGDIALLLHTLHALMPAA